MFSVKFGRCSNIAIYKWEMNVYYSQLAISPNLDGLIAFNKVIFTTYDVVDLVCLRTAVHAKT